MKYVFYVSDKSLTAYTYNGSKQNSSETFEWSNVDQIDNYLAGLDEKAQTEVILDLIDEELNFEWAPKVHIWEREGIVARRKERLQTDSTLFSEVKWSGITRVSDEGRKEELLMSFTVADSYNVTTFLQNLEEAQAVVRKVHSKAVLLGQYLQKKIRPHLKLSRQDLNKPLLMITRQGDNSFRQTFFYEGQLRLSRLVELDQGYQSVDEIRNGLITETKLAIAYVYNQKIVPFNSPIGFLFLGGEQEMLDGILAKCQEEDIIRTSWDENEYFIGTVNFKDILDCEFNCAERSTPCYSPQAVADLVLTTKPSGFYENPYVRKINNFFIGRSILSFANLGLFLFGLYYVLITGIDSWLSWEKQKILEQKIVQHQNEKTRLENMVKLQDDALRIKASVEFSEAILELKVNRLISFDVNALSHVFENNPNIQLSEIKWTTAGKLDSRTNQINISAWVFPFYETYEDPVRWVDKFVAELGEVKTVQVASLQKEPLNRNLKKALTITTDLSSVEALPFTVSLRIQDVKPK